MKALMVGLMAWASVHTGLPVPDGVPEIRRMEACQMHWMQHPGTDCDPENVAIHAIYLDRTIYLRTDWTHETLLGTSTLLHELVHYMQEEAGLVMGADNPCHGANIEKPAWDAQLDFLRAAGVEDPLAMLNTNALYLMFALNCFEQ